MSEWHGWHVGMTGEPVRAAKHELRRRFSYAAALDETPYFGDDLRIVLCEYQTRKGLPTSGVLDSATQVALGTAKPQPVGTLFTVAGTYADMWTGYPADVARAVADVWYFQPVNYPAAVFPMGPSVEQGKRELRRLITERPGHIALAGYSQGGIVVSEVWQHDIRDPRGCLHNRIGDVVAAVTWGNPCREEGVANGNLLSALPIPEGRGIASDRLVDTPAWWLDFAHGANSGMGKDIYTSTSDDPEAAEHMESIFRVVQGAQGWYGSNNIIEQVAEMFINPGREIPAVVRAVWDGGMFVCAGDFPTAAHCNYDIRPAIDYLRGFR